MFLLWGQNSVPLFFESLSLETPLPPENGTDCCDADIPPYLGELPNPITTQAVTPSFPQIVVLDQDTETTAIVTAVTKTTTKPKFPEIILVDEEVE